MNYLYFKNVNKLCNIVTLKNLENLLRNKVRMLAA